MKNQQKNRFKKMYVQINTRFKSFDLLIKDVFISGIVPATNF